MCVCARSTRVFAWLPWGRQIRPSHKTCMANHSYLCQVHNVNDPNDQIKILCYKPGTMKKEYFYIYEIYESHQLNITSSWASSKAAFRPLIWIQCPRQKETSPCTGFAYVLEMHEWCGQNFPVKAVGSCYFHCDLQMYYFNPRKPPCTLHVQITIDKENIQHMNINLKEIFG